MEWQAPVSELSFLSSTVAKKWNTITLLGNIIDLEHFLNAYVIDIDTVFVMLLHCVRLVYGFMSLGGTKRLQLASIWRSMESNPDKGRPSL